MKGKTRDLNHDLTFSAHTINCVCHSIRSMFRVLGIYNFGGRALQMKSTIESVPFNKMSKMTIWTYYEVVKENNNLAKCTLCSIKLSRGGLDKRTWDTSNLNKNLKNKHQILFSFFYLLVHLFPSCAYCSVHMAHKLV